MCLISSTKTIITSIAFSKALKEGQSGMSGDFEKWRRLARVDMDRFGTVKCQVVNGDMREVWRVSRELTRDSRCT